MNKENLLKLANNKDEKLLISKLIDVALFAEKTNYVKNSRFLNGREQVLATAVFNSIGIGYKFFGGYDQFERAIAVCFTDEMYLDTYCFPVKVFDIKLKNADKLNHRDYLGSIMGLGIKREMIGDIRFPEGNLIDDEYFTYRVIGNAKKLARSSACMYAYRQQPGSAMHKAFSLRRLQGLEAKVQRLEYLEERMPSLVYEAKFDLFFTAMFMMQECLRFLKGAELEQAGAYIREILQRITPLEKHPEASAKKNLLLKLAQINFEGTCKLLNFLIDMHVLT